MNQSQSSTKKSSNADAILVINCGSSSVKFSLIQPNKGKSLLSGLAERLLTADAIIKIKQHSTKQSDVVSLTPPYDHRV